MFIELIALSSEFISANSMQHISILFRSAAAVTAGALAFSACGGKDAAASPADSQAAHIREVVAAGGVVDSILPISEQLRRFRADLADHPDTLRHASSSLDVLARRWGKAVATRDSTALNEMTLDRAEFAWIYYPGSKLSKPPYEAPPQLLWGQILANSDEGARHVITRFGGKQFVVESVTCPAPSDTTEASVVRSECRVKVKTASGTLEDRLFGSIIEHQGRFKFLSYSNGL